MLLGKSKPLNHDSNMKLHYFSDTITNLHTKTNLKILGYQLQERNWKYKGGGGLKSQSIYSRFTSRVTSISENEMNIRIALCHVRHVNGMLNISLEIFVKKTH